MTLTNNLNLDGSHAGLKDKDSCYLCGELKKLKLYESTYGDLHWLCRKCAFWHKINMEGYYAFSAKNL